ncbi:alpha-galactosidase [Eisenbergiella tayi]|uniref:alpha-galactosidase n=1 Tax=Eisenbergiella tayi TaxID=1432052 RepID=UPI0005D20D46|nr:alpha-galactosidase [Eisenbergiella tayi]ODR33919.1 alpha-galactosidase [Eisenbergiella tayi]
MPIIFNAAFRQFHLLNNKISYIMHIMENGQLEHLYFGKCVCPEADFSYLAERGHRDMQACPLPDQPYFSPEHIRQEYPCFGYGDMRMPAFEIERENGSRVVDFKYVGHRIYHGKKPLDPLPGVYCEPGDDVETLEITLTDEQIHTDIILYYTIFESAAALIRHAEFSCHGEERISVETAMSFGLDLPDMDYEMIDLAGSWSRERHIRRHSLDYGIQSVYSLRGSCSSHQFNPFIALARRDTGENSGEVIGMSLLYSGDFLAQAEVDNFGVTRVTMGIHPQEFSWTLYSGEKFVTPEAVIVYSDKGIGEMSSTYHWLYRNRLARGMWRDRERPILINNWEATYFSFNEESLLKIARKAADIGIELFVLDDGWFGHRNDSKSSLGDWYVNKEKLQGGLKGFAEKINSLGMGFGIWIEPEMVSEDSDLYRKHPDWVLGDKRRILSKARNQYVLDFSRPEVVDEVYRQLADTFRGLPITYIKWDHNRSMSEVFSAGGNREYQGTVRHRFILGMYSLYAKMTAAFPDILFESCASGGARFDPGMLYYAPQAWCSDNTDAIERIRIQYGTSLVYPLSSIGSHVSAVPNEQIKRITPLRTRAAVAYFGTFGYEQDLTKASEEELAEMKLQISFMKKYRNLIQKGTFCRLISPFEKDGNIAAWEVISEDGKEVLAAYFRILQKPEAPYTRLRLAGLEEKETYLCQEVNNCCEADAEAEKIYRSGSELMNIGLIMSDESSGCKGVAAQVQGDFLARMFLLKKQSPDAE